MNKNKEITFVEAINDALNTAMSIDDNVICLGLGATDPRGIFGTTLGLKEKYGSDRVIDPPTSENANTGIAIGAAIDGIRPVVIHQRTDFSLLTLDQIINNSAKCSGLILISAFIFNILYKLYNIFKKQGKKRM